ncbi:MAG: lactate racemase domain-containing protein [Desulfuromonadaceae bacterium]
MGHHLISAESAQSNIPLIGTSRELTAPASGAAPEQGGNVNSIVIRTHEHYGDIEERLDFPDDWDIQVQHMTGHNAPVLGADDIMQRLRTPIGTQTLRELARGKGSAVITFDDLTRPTPIHAVAPLVVEELLAAGVPAERIVFLGSYGTHRSLEQDEAVRKLGQELLKKFAWINHNIWDNLTEVGTTSAGNVITINRTFAESDLRITLSGVKIHGFAGYGGGAKAILPGIAGFDTVRYNHTVVKETFTEPHAGVIPVYGNEIRADMEEAARLARVDFSVQIVYNGERRVSGIFAGDIIAAHRTASRFAINHYRTDVVADPDVVVNNSYPQATQAKVNSWINSVRAGGSAVLIIQHPQGVSAMHYFEQHREGQGGRTQLDQLGEVKPPLPGDRQLIVFSQYADKRLAARFPTDTVFTDRWDEVIARIQARHQGRLRVAVYPYAAIQHRETKLDEPSGAA